MAQTLQTGLIINSLSGDNETLLVNGKIKTNDIQILPLTGISFTGYVLTVIDLSGNTSWQPISSSSNTINTLYAGDVKASIVEAQVGLKASKLRSFSPLDINDNDEGNVYFGSLSAITVDLSNHRLGLGTTTPSERLDVSGNTKISGGLNIGTIGSGTSVINLGLDNLGNIVTGTTGGGSEETTQGTGVTIHFSAKTIFNLPTSPSTGNITNNLTNAKLGLIQKIYHNDSVEPTFPVGWVLVGEGTYFTNELNIIYAEYVTNSWIEYWIIQIQ